MHSVVCKYEFDVTSSFPYKAPMTPREAAILLNLVDGIGPIKVRAMIDALGNASAVFEASPGELFQIPGIGRELASRIHEAPERLDVAGEIKRASKLGARIISLLDEEYPAPLKEIHDPPLALYTRGAWDAHDVHAIGLIGSRRTSHYGRATADRLAYQLATAGFTVVSGLARGIDTAAHEGALKAQGRTGAVIGSALDKLYPPENRELADRIEGAGFVMSEFPLGTAPGRTTFPMRNRIVSGLCQGVIVVEAGRNSGALITARQATEQGRHVFAVPGRIDAPTSKGCHDLIKDGAKLVDDVDDVIDELQQLIPQETRARAQMLDARPEVQLSEPEQAIVRALWEGPRDVDSVARETGVAVAQISTHLLTLEMKRVVRALPGRMVELAERVRQ